MSASNFCAHDAAVFFDLVKGFSPEALVELRVLKRDRGGALCGFFDRRGDFILACGTHSGHDNVYAGLQSRPQCMLNLAPNELRPLPSTTKAEDIEILQTFFVDIDPVRPRDCASTQSELELAREVAKQIIDWARKQGYRKPLVVMSGNGYHLFFSLPATILTPEKRGEIASKIKCFEKAIKDNFETAAVKIDTVSDFPRIVRVPGTLNLKGLHTEDRPHRLSRIIGGGL